MLIEAVICGLTNTKLYKAGVSKRIKDLLTEIDQLPEQEEILYGDKHLAAPRRRG